MSLFNREGFICHPTDDNFVDTMKHIICEGDVNKLHKYLECLDDNCHYPAVLDICLEWRATECALYIIQGKLPHGHPILAHDHIDPKPQIPVLYQVIHRMCEPHVFHLLLTDCRASNQANQPFFDLLPLHFLLDLLTTLPPFSEWSPGKPLYDLIDSLFLPQFRPKLESARILAQHTHSLDQVALGYLLNGEIIPLAALLLVAPFTKGDFETITKSYTSIIASQAIHDQSVTPSTYCAAAALLYIFQKDGDKLTSKFKNEHEPAGLLLEVKHSEIQVLSTDVNLADNDSTSCHLQMLKSICERLGETCISIDDTTQVSRKSPFPSVGSVKKRYQVTIVPSIKR